MMPWERDVYVELVIQAVKKEKEDYDKMETENKG